MRTVRRQVADLNSGKRETLAGLIRAYAAEKQYWLQIFAQRDSRIAIKHHRDIRNAAVARGYESASGLQARMWKLALIDAAETWDKYWQALFVEMRSKIGRRKDYNETKRHYAFWLLSGYQQFFQMTEGEAPVPKFKIDAAALPKIAAYLRRSISQLRGKQPSIRKARSAVLDANCYTCFVENGRQYLKIMTLERGKRIVLPLSGNAAICGNIRVVMDHSGIEVHVPQALAEKKQTSGVIAAVDFGYTEAMTDADGNAYGENLGKIITAASNDRNSKGKARNKLRALAEKFAASALPAKLRKARHIRQFNLGKIKWHRREHKARAAIACEINTGLNQLIQQEQPSVLVTEDLRHAFTFDKPKSWNRKLSAWTRGVLQDRTEFKGVAEGFRHEQVNPAYGSQACPRCGFVDKRNRNGDKFQCLHCKLEGHADQVAATNILSRMDDREITRYTPYREVKTILLKRFHRRLELEGAQALDMTVPGRTLDDVIGSVHLPAGERETQVAKTALAGRSKKLRQHPASAQRAKQSENGIARDGDYV